MFILLHGKYQSYTRICKPPFWYEKVGSPQEISKDSIEKHIQEIYQNLDKFLLDFGNHFIKEVDPNKRVPKICLLNGDGYVGARERSLNEIMHKNPGICHTPLYQCPIRQYCQAFKNVPEKR